MACVSGKEAIDDFQDTAVLQLINRGKMSRKPAFPTKPPHPAFFLHSLHRRPRTI
jgi:hypothetical protein